MTSSTSRKGFPDARAPTRAPPRIFATVRGASRTQPLAGEAGPQEAHAAVDVVPHATGGDSPLVEVHRRHSSDGEAVSPVDVGHPDAVPEDPRRGGHVQPL